MRLEDFDIFPKLRDDYRSTSTHSGVLTVVSVLIMGYLFLSQSFSFFLTPPKQRLRVDESRFPTIDGTILDFEHLPRVQIHFDLTLPSLPCAFVNFGVIDNFKDLHDDAFSKVKLKRIEQNGAIIHRKQEPVVKVSECGSCYGAAQGCCNSCKDVKRAFKAKGKVPPPLYTLEQCRGRLEQYQSIKNEQCRIYGTVVVPPISGIFYIAPGDSYGARSKHVADYLAMNLTIDDFNLTHKIASFFVGAKDAQKGALDGVRKVQKQHGRIKVVYFVRAMREGSSYGDLYRTTVTQYERYREGNSSKFPGIFFHYDVSPIVVEYKRDVSVLHFLVQLMAILGGVYSIALLLDRLFSPRPRQEATSIS
jgi:hypothetical protein